MSGLLHPVGPEPAATYWLRRALVLGVLALVAVVVTALVTPESRRQQAVPAAASGLSVAGATPPGAGQGSTSATVSAPTSPSKSRPGTPKPAPSKSATSKSASPAAAGAARAGAATSRRSTASTGKAARLPKCPADRLRTTLTGREHLKVQQSTVFDVSVINGSATSCVVDVTADNFAVTIRSGRDRIWSTRDCSKAVGSHRQKRASQDGTAWRLKWNGRRSAPSCRSRPEIPRPGTYVATAQLKGADPVRVRMVLHG